MGYSKSKSDTPPPKKKRIKKKKKKNLANQCETGGVIISTTHMGFKEDPFYSLEGKKEKVVGVSLDMLE
jgi:hypothetical protein